MRAAKKAQAAIQDDGWEIITVDETFIAERERYLDLPESLEQAEIDGEAYLFNTWPLEPQENDIIHWNIVESNKALNLAGKTMRFYVGGEVV